MPTSPLFTRYRADQKKSLFDYFGIALVEPGTVSATRDQLSSVSPNTTLMSDGAIIPNDAIDVYKQRHPNATAVGGGTKREDDLGGR
jgi:hypothetical protein